MVAVLLQRLLRSRDASCTETDGDTMGHKKDNAEKNRDTPLNEHERELYEQLLKELEEYDGSEYEKWKAEHEDVTSAEMLHDMTDDERRRYMELLNELGVNDRQVPEEADAEDEDARKDNAARQRDLDILGLKDGQTVEESYEYLEKLFDEDRYGIAGFFMKHNECLQNERFPEMRRYAYDDPSYNLTKLIEEVGEVAETISKEQGVDRMAIELADVRHCVAMFERIIHPEKMRKAKMLCMARNYIRGYYSKDGKAKKDRKQHKDKH